MQGSCDAINHLFFFPPARIRWIWRPLLKAWLNSSLDWKSETKGNHAKIAMGAKITSDIRYSYPLAKPFTDPHMCIFFTVGLQACDTSRRNHPVGKKANKLANISPTISSRNFTAKIRITTNETNMKSFISLNASWKSALSLSLPIAKTLKMIMAPRITSQEKA